MPIWWPFAVGGALLTSACLTPVCARLALRLGLVDAPLIERKQHASPTPVLGGLSIFVALAIPTALILLLTDHLTAGDMDVGHFIGFFVGAVVLIVGGVLDDKYAFPPRLSILFPLLAAVCAVAFGIGVEKVTNPFGGVFLLTATTTIILTFVWLLGMTYTTKLLDGLDGLATGLTLIGSVMIGLLALSEAYFQPDVAVLALMFAAALFGFWLWNIHPAKIFLGEGGSTLLGYTLGVLAVIAGSKFATTLLVVGLPMLDVGLVVYHRWRAGRSIFNGDRTHFHHLLLRAGLSAPQALVVYLAIASAFGLTTLMFESWQKITALGVLVIVASLGLHYLYLKYCATKYVQANN